MKKTLLLGAFLAALTSAKADTIAGWTFESNFASITGSSTDFAGYAAEVGTGTATGHHATAATWSSPAGNGSSHSFSVNTWAVNDYFQLQVSTVGFTDISVSYDQTSSGTGPRDFTFSYSTDGSIFTPVGVAYTVLANGGSPNPSWNGTTSSSAYSYLFDLSSAPELNNARTVYFRLTDSSTVSANGGTVSSGGTDRIDNFVVSGTVAVVPEPSTFAVLGIAGLAFLARRRKA